MNKQKKEKSWNYKSKSTEGKNHRSLLLVQENRQIKAARQKKKSLTTEV